MDIFSLNSDDYHLLDGLRPDNWGDIKPAHKFYLSSDFCFPHKAVINGEIVGVGTAIIFEKSAWLAHVIVLPKYRNRGIGTTIIKYLIDFVNRFNSIKTISLMATELGYPLYRKVGFNFEEEYHFYSRDIDKKESFEIDKSIVKYSDIYFEKLSNLDIAVYGEDRSAMFINNLSESYLYIKGNDLVGAYLKGYNDEPVIAIDVNAGIELLKLKTSFNRVVAVPKSNVDAISFLKLNGFKKAMVGKRMRIGDRLNWNPKFIFSREGGNIG